MLSIDWKSCRPKKAKLNPTRTVMAYSYAKSVVLLGLLTVMVGDGA